MSVLQSSTYHSSPETSSGDASASFSPPNPQPVSFTSSPAQTARQLPTIPELTPVATPESQLKRSSAFGATDEPASQLDTTAVICDLSSDKLRHYFNQYSTADLSAAADKLRQTLSSSPFKSATVADVFRTRLARMEAELARRSNAEFEETLSAPSSKKVDQPLQASTQAAVLVVPSPIKQALLQPPADRLTEASCCDVCKSKGRELTPSAALAKGELDGMEGRMLCTLCHEYLIANHKAARPAVLSTMGDSAKSTFHISVPHTDLCTDSARTHKFRDPVEQLGCHTASAGYKPREQGPQLGSLGIEGYMGSKGVHQGHRTGTGYYPAVMAMPPLFEQPPHALAAAPASYPAPAAPKHPEAQRDGAEDVYSQPSRAISRESSGALRPSERTSRRGHRPVVLDSEVVHLLRKVFREMLSLREEMAELRHEVYRVKKTVEYRPPTATVHYLT